MSWRQQEQYNPQQYQQQQRPAYAQQQQPAQQSYQQQGDSGREGTRWCCGDPRSSQQSNDRFKMIVVSMKPQQQQQQPAQSQQGFSQMGSMYQPQPSQVQQQQQPAQSQSSFGNRVMQYGQTTQQPYGVQPTQDSQFSYQTNPQSTSQTVQQQPNTLSALSQQLAQLSRTPSLTGTLQGSMPSLATPTPVQQQPTVQAASAQLTAQQLQNLTSLSPQQFLQLQQTLQQLSQAPQATQQTQVPMMSAQQIPQMQAMQPMQTQQMQPMQSMQPQSQMQMPSQMSSQMPSLQSQQMSQMQVPQVQIPQQSYSMGTQSSMGMTPTTPPSAGPSAYVPQQQSQGMGSLQQQSQQQQQLLQRLQQMSKTPQGPSTIPPGPSSQMGVAQYQPQQPAQQYGVQQQRSSAQQPQQQSKTSDLGARNQPPSNRTQDRRDNRTDNRRPSGFDRMDRDKGPRRRSPERRRSPPRRRSPIRDRKKRSKSRSRSPSHSRSRSRSPPSRDTKHSQSEKSDEKEKERKYSIVLPNGSFVEADRDYLNLKRRYPRLQISEEFTKFDPLWTRTVPYEARIHTSVVPPMYPEYDSPTEKDDKEEALGFADKVAPSGRTYNVKVMLMAFEESPKNVPVSGPTHITHQLKFLVAKQDRSDLMCVGGFWSAKLDGGNPDVNDAPLRATAIRYTKKWTQLDLSSCAKWHKFVAIHYNRPATKDSTEHEEVTVIYVPDLTTLVQPMKDFLDLWTKRYWDKKEKKSQKKEEEKAAPSGETQPTESTETPAPEKKEEKQPKNEPKVAGILVTSGQPECVLISLDGLLDYNESDKHEKTFEVSLFAESFYEMMCRDHGTTILQTLILSAFQADRKRRRDEEDEPSKKQKAEVKDEAMSDVLPDSEAKTAIKEESVEQSNQETKAEPVVKEEPKVQKKIVDAEVLRAFHFFDRNQTGYLKSDDLETLLHYLGQYYSKQYVQRLVSKHEGKDKRVLYKKLTEKEITASSADSI